MRKNNKNVLIVGSSRSVKGGMTSVLETYESNGIFKDTAYFLPSHKRGTSLYKIFYFSLFIFKYIYYLMYNFNIKIVHVHSSYRGSFFRKMIIIYVAKFFHKKTIFHLHGSEFNLFYNNCNKIVKIMITSTLNTVDVIIVLSKYWEESIRTKTNNKSIFILYNSVHIPKNHFKRSQTKYIKVLFMGNIGHRKGTFDLINSFKLLEDNILLTIYGDGEIDKASRIIHKEHLGQKIKLAGWITGEEIYKAYHDSDIFVLPSYHEGLPMSILEAMSFSLPIISTPVGGIPEQVKNGFNGYLVHPGNIKAIASKIEKLAGDPDLRKKMGKNSLKIINEKFDEKKMIERLTSLYGDLSVKSKNSS